MLTSREEGTQILRDVKALRAEDIILRSEPEDARDPTLIRKVVQQLMREVDSIDFHIALRRSGDPIAIMEAFELLSPASWRRRSADDHADEIVSSMQFNDEPVFGGDILHSLIKLVMWPWIAYRDQQVANLQAFNDDHERRALVLKLIQTAPQQILNTALEKQHLFKLVELDLITKALADRRSAA